MRLDKFLSDTTELTRTLAKKALHREEVTVDGDVVKNPATQVDENSEVVWLGEPLELVGLRYIMLHKPQGYECTTRRGLHPTVLELIDLPKAERLHAVGRLDVDTTGLVLLTDDGQWSHRVTSPKHRCAKIYHAVLAEPVVPSAVEEFAQGILLDAEEQPTAPAELEILDPYHVRLSLMEGKYHQIKRMFGALGNRVVSLHRERIGPIALDDELAPGEWRELTEEEIGRI
ncbi:16S rRNA pseudouridine(516) synthase RsuA [Halomonas shantousis]